MNSTNNPKLNIKNKPKNKWMNTNLMRIREIMVI